jgi:GrpB-like predicted nucleotidyltransferase (UPF0157 family)
MNPLVERIRKVIQEEVNLVPYDPRWRQMFDEEKNHLLSCLPAALIKRIEHFGITAIPGLSAKPIIDILVEAVSLEEAKSVVVPILTAQEYEYFWRPSFGDDIPPFYAWFIKRNKSGQRTHHIHMVEKDFEHWDRLLFRDYLIESPEIAKQYEALKIKLANEFPSDRVVYTNSKTEFIVNVTNLAKKYYSKKVL